MNEAKFTKGPWIINPIEDDKEYIRIRGGALGGRFKVANVLDLKSHHCDHQWCKDERAESLANAKLIKASPKMYAMLETLSSMMPMLDEQTHPSIEMDAIKHDIDTLLAEARGE